MTESPSSRPGLGQWLILLAMAFWLAVVPLTVVALLAVAANRPPDLLVQLGLVAPGNPSLPVWALGLLTTAMTLVVQLFAFVPLYMATGRPGREFLHATATLTIAIALFQTLNALGRLPWLQASAGLPDMSSTYSAAVRLVLGVSFLLFGLGWVEARRQDYSLIEAWRRVGLRLWLDSPVSRLAFLSAAWLALGTAAIVVWPWVVVGSLGSGGTTAANALQALPNALDQEILFRGFALAWLWRAMAPALNPRRERGGPGGGAAAASLILFVAAQGGTILPHGDLGALPRFGAALALGLLTTELTVRAGGSVWPAVAVHFLYDWFHFAFVDPRSRDAILHWLAQGWAVVAIGGLGLVLWLGRKVVASMPSRPGERTGRGGLVASAGLAGVTWLAVILLYITTGVPGFHSDGFIIFLGEQADLNPAAAISNPVERRAWVYHTLVDTAGRSQASLRAELDAQGLAYRAHYLINAIEVLERPGLRRRLAGEPGVAAVLFQPGVRPYAHNLNLPSLGSSSPGGVEWNVHAVGADRVWALGYTGQGIVVSSADTGVDWQHPALKKAYLGWDGSAADHNYHWYDPWDGSVEPVDDSGHGTHTTGTMVGQDGQNKIGLAPGARWIACRNMRHGIGNPGAYLSCMEFLLAPFPLAGDPLRDGDPAQGAQVVNNSWGCPREEGCLPDTLRTAVDNLRVAGQMMVVSAGNDGPACGTVQDPPALYSATFGVGAIQQDDEVASFSSRGPVTVDGSDRLKPDVSAPGVNIRSSVPGGYAIYDGTSMAGPHVAGAVALLWSADPALVGDLDRTETLLTQTAQPLKVDGVCPSGETNLAVACACNGDGPNSVPNNVYGWGLIDAWTAVQQIVTSR
jgi:subtilisin family serine protease